MRREIEIEADGQSQSASELTRTCWRDEVRLSQMRRYAQRPLTFHDGDIGVLGVGMLLSLAEASNASGALRVNEYKS